MRPIVSFALLFTICMISFDSIATPISIQPDTTRQNIESHKFALSFKQNELTTDIIYKNKTYSIQLFKTRVFSPSYKIITEVNSSKLDLVTTYRGKVLNNSLTDKGFTPVTATVTDQSISIKILESLETIHANSDNKNSLSNFTVYSTPELDNNNDINYQEPMINMDSDIIKSTLPKSQQACGVKRATLSFDCSGDCYTFFNNDLNNLNRELATTVNNLNAIYVRDLRIELELGTVLVRDNSSTDPYVNMTDSGELLEKLRSDWNSTDRGDYDLAALIDPDIGGGLAYVGTICTESRYSINGLGSSFFPILRHELGHNFGSSHFEGGSPEGKTIMSGNDIPRFSGPEKDKIMAHRDTRTCLEDIGNHSISIEPYAHFDDAEIDQAQSKIINVLANDEDANCDTFNLDSIETASSLGNKLSVSGNDILYEANSNNSGTDTFSYKVLDSDGNSAIGNVRVMVKAAPTPPPAPVTPTPEPSSSGGGSNNFLSLLALCFVLLFRKKRLS